MSNAYGAVLSTLAVAILTLRGVLAGDEAVIVLQECLSGMLVFYGIGFLLGFLAESVLRQSAERRFREAVTRYLDEKQARQK
jgi:NhaP-type Na+/H+ or K+/H+ antiporter